MRLRFSWVGTKYLYLADKNILSFMIGVTIRDKANSRTATVNLFILVSIDLPVCQQLPEFITQSTSFIFICLLIKLFFYDDQVLAYRWATTRDCRPMELLD